MHHENARLIPRASDWPNAAADIKLLGAHGSPVRSRLRRQDRDHFHFEQIGRVGQARNLQQRRGRQRRLVRGIGRTHFAVDCAVLIHVDQVADELDDVLEAAADRRERGLDVLNTCTA